MNLEFAKAIVILPGTALVFVPAAILWLVPGSESGMALAGPAQARFWLALALGACGFAFAVWTTRLFRTVGEGTPAPWAPPKRLVVRGPYRRVRNPMISSVLLMLGAESLFFGSWHLAGWMLVFFLGNTIYFPLVEERALERRFGDDYRRYKANV
ncbi:MAG: isoprenylcysteine carboxylmethyltransferase family protein, partial [Gammaproteobacteria bacterium]|nr:isoprenylcysteine carboxylmethyltransferase family protein [Gammaproteobacteria bacterium]